MRPLSISSALPRLASEQPRMRVVEELRELVVGVTHPPVVQVFALDDESRTL